MKENQKSITLWADQTFGMAITPARVAARANEEMAELLSHATAGEDPEHLAEEAADVVIVLMRLASVLGKDLLSEIDRKMSINRGRTWERDGTGHGYHVRS